MSFVLGQMTQPFGGNISQLRAIILADYRATEANLGFHAGRLSNGFKLLLLKSPPRPDDFEFQGTTLRSGGRFGLPAATYAEDAKREAVHDSIMSERGAAGYRALQEHVLGVSSFTGPDRFVKVMPDTRHDGAMSPADQYPMGGGFLQWDLKKPGLPFLYAANFRPDGTVITEKETFQLNSGKFLADYPQRQKLQKFLQTV
ncbi:hypothetical protein [Roseibium aggregatum]|uniref:Uncharacterized protein n=1 Tax=Roseibium aggregatum TaxID=187304 RepID=A0A939EKR3_9HYPH|nr:hypothetical protein [Roseibium aggregatum]MBN9673465.1 hypothetical protein [Roseibium aggregatum]